MTVTGTNNCINKDSFTVSVKAIPVFTVSADKSVCLNDKAQLNASGGNSYLWNPAPAVTNATIPDPLAIASITTPYTVLIKDTLCGDDTTLTTTITVLPLPTVTAAKENDINCAIGSTNLNATGALQYSWTPARALSDAASATPIASPLNTTTYTVKGTDSAGCSNTAAVTVYTDYSVRVSYTMPNAFSPNGDGDNDVFYPRGIGLQLVSSFRIYNRWGELVYQHDNIDANDATVGWDGTYKGDAPRPDVYVYLLEADCSTGEPINIKGDITIIR